LVRTIVVLLLIDLPADHRYHLATLPALRHASDASGIPVEVRVVPTDTIRDPSHVADAASAVIVGPGSPYRNPDAAHEVVRRARERNLPLVGT